LEDIAYSDVIGQVCSVVIGLFDKDQGIEVDKQRKVTILKGRNGEIGSFKINWYFDAQGPEGFMDFSELKLEGLLTAI